MASQGCTAAVWEFDSFYDQPGGKIRGLGLRARTTISMPKFHFRQKVARPRPTMSILAADTSSNSGNLPKHLEPGLIHLSLLFTAQVGTKCCTRSENENYICILQLN